MRYSIITICLIIIAVALVLGFGAIDKELYHLCTKGIVVHLQ